jgi:hypothetical protein
LFFCDTFRDNQAQIEEDIRLRFEPDPTPSYVPKDFETAETARKGHGRLEQPTFTVSRQIRDLLD